MNTSLTLAERVELWLILRHDCRKACTRIGVGPCFQCGSAGAFYHYTHNKVYGEILYYAGSCGACIERAL